MKILTKEEERAHYYATVQGGTIGGIIGLGVGTAAVYGASIRYPAFRSLTLPMKTFLATSAGTFAAIIQADRSSRGFEASRHPEIAYKDEASQTRQAMQARMSNFEKLKAWGKENRYPIVGASWAASMGIAFALVGRNPYLSKQQKLVQARVYAQFLTLMVLVATAAFEIGDKNEGKGRWETVMIVDPNDPEHKHLIEKRVHHETYQGEDLWKDMVATEERKMKDRETAREHRNSKTKKE